MSEQSQLGPSTEGSVVLDIGGNLGALIIQTPPTMAGAEIEISLEQPDSRPTHVAVRERRGPGGSRYAAIYPSLRAGTYAILDSQGNPAAHADVTGGHITTLDWRADVPETG